jgi:hypothetical protein
MLFKRIALGFGIAIILPMMLHWGVSTFVPKPKYPEHNISVSIESIKEKNVEKREQWMTQKEKYEKELKHFQIYLFFVSVPLGIIAIILGAFIPFKAIGAGMIFGGIFSVCDGYINYWSELSAALRFISLLAAFIVLILVGYKKIESRTT